VFFFFYGTKLFTQELLLVLVAQVRLLSRTLRVANNVRP